MEVSLSGEAPLIEGAPSGPDRGLPRASRPSGSRGRPGRPKVLFVPDFRRGNPYQQRLAECLEGLGFDVVFSPRDARLSFLWEITRRRPTLDLLHVHWPENYIGARSVLKLLAKAGLFLILLLFLRLRGVRVVWTVHNLEYHDSHHPRLEGLTSRAIARVCHGLAVHFPQAEEIVRRQLQVAARKPIVLTPLGHDPPVVKEQRHDGRPNDAVTFCHLGELRTYKNVPLIMRAFRSLSERSVRLVIAGRPHEASLARLLEESAAMDDRITLHLGYLGDREMEGYLAASDVFVVGSHRFFTSASVLQAASWGLAILAPRHPHLAYLLDPSGWVKYVPDDQDSLRDAMSALAQHRISGEPNRRRVSSFTYSRMAAETADLYRAVLP